MRRFIAILTVLVLAAAANAALSRPNILLILTDDMGYGDLTCYGAGVGVPTANIDRLAARGIRFTQYYAASPLCSPTRAAMLCGRFPGRLRINSYLQTRAGNRQCEQDDYLDPDIPTLPRLLKSGGYATGHVGKWHLGGGRDVTDAPSIGRYGYDEWVSTWESPQPDPKLGVQFAPWDRRTELGQIARHERTAYMVDRAIEFIRRHANGPWFLTFWPDDVHTPHRPGPEMIHKHGGSDDEKKTPKKNFLGVLEEYDRQIGRLMTALSSMGLEDNTLVIFTSDNGPEPHFGHQRTGGLRGMKNSLYEGGIREPFIVMWPARITSGKVDSMSVIAAVDLLPTLCAIAGVAIREDIAGELDGEDMSAALLGGHRMRAKTLFWEYGRNRQAYNRPNLPVDRSPSVAVREGKWKLLIATDGSHRELYDILADPREVTDLTTTTLALADALSSSALTWRKGLPRRK